ncbi:MAG TPA: hypothetical protein EYH06_05115 [Chromatiales bacterium]|nr:hypothetical protein [Chromatiales bacterium]
MRASISNDKILVREMGLTRKEFFRNLPRALHGYHHKINENNVFVETDDGQIKITVGEEGLRMISLLKIPYTKITMDFSEIQPETQNVFLRQFNLYYQKGGG